MKELLKINQDVLKQVLVIIENSDDMIYQYGNSLSSYGVGRHVRHVIDHYHAIQSGYATNQVNYNKRSRDSSIEQSRSVAKGAVMNILEWLGTPLEDKVLKTINDMSLFEEENIPLDSNFQRELCYLMSHSMHHVAYASLLLRSQGVHVDDDIGLAPSTKTYQRSA